jgi:hypothetical protein
MFMSVSSDLARRPGETIATAVPHVSEAERLVHQDDGDAPEPVVVDDEQLVHSPSTFSGVRCRRYS